MNEILNFLFQQYGSYSQVDIGLEIFAVFFGFIQEEFSASRFLVSLTVSMTILSAGIYSPLLGYILDKFPIKKVLTIGALIFGFGFILLSITQTFFQFLFVSFIGFWFCQFSMFSGWP